MFRHRYAFTLIELLVVIAIIAILAAILFPVFAQAKVAAKKTANISDHKQLGICQALYQGDYDDLYPLALTVVPGNVPGGLATNGTVTVLAWQNLIQPYAKTWAILIDPVSQWQISDPTKSYDPFLNFGVPPVSTAVGLTNWSDTWYMPTGSADFQGLFGAADDTNQDLYNLWLISPLTQNEPGMSQSAVASPASTIMATDATMSDWWLLVFGGGGSAGIGTDAFDYCITWPGIYPDSGANTGPLALYQASDPSTCAQSKSDTGLTTTEFADSHVAMQQIGEQFRHVTTPSGEVVYYHLWPGASL